MMKKLKIIIGMLTVCLIISLYFNFRPETPIYALNIWIPAEDGRSSTIHDVIDTSNDRDTYLYLMNVLEGYDLTEVEKELPSTIPDLILMRNIPSMGIASGIFGVFFENDLSYVIIGTEYEGQQIYQFDKESTKRIIEYTGFQPKT